MLWRILSDIVIKYHKDASDNVEQKFLWFDLSRTTVLYIFSVTWYRVSFVEVGNIVLKVKKYENVSKQLVVEYD